jgi:hypothetical protein
MADVDDDLGASIDDAEAENLIHALVKRLLAGASLAELCDDTGLPVLVDEHDQPVDITACHTYRQAGVMTLDVGVWLKLSDGSAFGLTLTVSRRPHTGTALRACAPDPEPTRRPRPPGTGLAAPDADGGTR